MLTDFWDSAGSTAIDLEAEWRRSVFSRELLVVVARIVFDRFCNAALATREAPDRLAIAVA